ncbi:MAG: rhomboid family intramembrane serine protease [Deltaproteobacteria bacterium]|nr:rhomboid family intramembrane serine protease [Deltaproteobacteria bacterium]
MRKIGSTQIADSAKILRWYLINEGIDTKVDELEENDCEIWVIHDKDVFRARALMEKFQNAENIEVYEEKATVGKKRWEKRVTELLKKRPIMVNARTQIFRRTVDSGSFLATYAFMAVSILFFLFQFVDRDRWLYRIFMISEDVYLSALGISAFREILSGEVWRLMTPIFIHTDFFHILFNMYWLSLFGKKIESQAGPWFLSFLVLAIAVPSNLAFYVVSGPLFGGMSGVVYGLFFFMWVYDRYKPGSRYFLDYHLFQFFVGFYVISWILSVFGFRIANTVHGIGALMGAVVGYLASGHHKVLRSHLRFNKSFFYNMLIGFVLILGGILTDVFTK